MNTISYPQPPNLPDGYYLTIIKDYPSKIRHITISGGIVYLISENPRLLGSDYWTSQIEWFSYHVLLL
jgi:hypothetical protein